jgi:hypothetical protein
MNTLSIKRFGFALGAASTLAYIGCVVVVATVSKETAVRFFNTLMHGIDVEPIMRWDMPMGEMLLGVVETFILAWLFGAVIAAIYNLAALREK